MAINRDVYTENEILVGIAEQDTWGTQIVADTSINKLCSMMAIYKPTDGIQRDNSKRCFDGSNVPALADNYVSEHGGMYTVQVDGVFSDITADLLTYGVMQDVTEAAGSPFLKTSVWDVDTVSPDFAGSSGQLYTVCVHDPLQGWYMKDSVISNLKVTYDSTQADPKLTFSATFTSSQPPVNDTFDPSDWDGITGATPYLHPDLKQIAGVDMVLSKFEIDFVNSVARVGADDNGDAQQYFMGGGKGWICTGSCDVKYDNNTKDKIDIFKAGTSESVVLLWGNGTSDGTLKFTVNAIYSGISHSSGEAQGIFVNLPFDAVTNGSTESIEVLVTNDINRGW